LLELTREFAHDQRSGEADELHRRHAEYFASVAERAQLEFGGPDHLQWLDRLDDDAMNLRAAQAYSSSGAGQAELGPQLAAALGEYWELPGRLIEGRQWLDRLLSSADPASGLVRARALAVAASLALAQGDEARGLEHAQAAMGRASWTRSSRPVLERLRRGNHLMKDEKLARLRRRSSGWSPVARRTAKLAPRCTWPRKR
jgi:hypothetical protein